MKFQIATAIALGASLMPPGISGAEPTNATRAAFNLERGCGRFNAAPLKTDGEKHYQSTVVELLDNGALDALEEMGCVVFGHRDNLALVCVPDESIDLFLDCPLLGEMESASTCTITNDAARVFTGSETVLNYSPTGYDGTGVVLGLSDTGFDAGHSAFAGRVRRFSHFKDSEGTFFRHDTEDAILTQGTDNPAQTHATMCANILGGARESSPYYGMAPGSDLVVATSELYDAGMLAGIDEVIEYARAVGKPAVVSLSIANFTGPHDGSDLACRYLSKQAEEAVVVISAGNSGMSTNTVRGRLSENNTTLRVALKPSAWGNKTMTGVADIWSRDSRPFGLSLVIWDKATDKEVYRRKICDKTSYAPQDVVIFAAQDSEGIGKFFIPEGGIALSSGIYTPNGRFNVSLNYNLTTETTSGGLPDYLVILEVEGEEGQELHFFSDGSRSSYDATGIAGSLRGSSELSISNLATAKNVLCVGSVTAQRSFTLQNGYSFNVPDLYVYNSATPFTSYGLDLADGRSYPDILAPGVGIMTAVSSYRNPDRGYCVTAPSGRTDYWRADDGTSFSAPAVAGIIAQWYQANLALSPARMREIATATASKDLVDPDDPRTGSGKIDAIAGLRRVLLEDVPSGTVSIETTTPLVIRADSGSIIADCRTDGVALLEVFTPSGSLVGHSTSGRVDGIAPGLYICRATSGAQTIIKRIIL